MGIFFLTPRFTFLLDLRERRRVKKESKKGRNVREEGLEIKVTSHETKFPQIKPMRI